LATPRSRPPSIMYNMQFDLYMATRMLVNLAKERIINVSPLHRVVKYGKKILGSVFETREERERNVSIAKVQRSRNQQSSIPPVITRLLSMLLLCAVGGGNRARGRPGAIEFDPRMNARLSRNGTVVSVNRRGSLSRKRK